MNELPDLARPGVAEKDDWLRAFCPGSGTYGQGDGVGSLADDEQSQRQHPNGGQKGGFR